MKSDVNSEKTGSRMSFWPDFGQKRRFFKEKVKKSSFGH